MALFDASFFDPRFGATICHCCRGLAGRVGQPEDHAAEPTYSNKCFLAAIWIEQQPLQMANRHSNLKVNRNNLKAAVRRQRKLTKAHGSICASSSCVAWFLNFTTGGKAVKLGGPPPCGDLQRERRER